MSAFDFKELKRHIGHDIVCVGYGKEGEPPINVAIECETCYEVLLDFNEEDTDDKPNNVQ